MLKLSKRLLALSVSVVLASSALLAGCGKVEGDADEDTKQTKKSESITDSAETALKTVENAAQNIEDIFTGKADKAYSSEIKLSIGKPLAEELELDEIQDVVFTSDVKAKGGNVETILGVKYGNDEVISADVIREDGTGNVYLGFEQLSPGYLMVSGDDLDAYIEEYSEYMFGTTLNLTGNEGTVTDEDFEIPDMSEEEIEEWLAPYEQAVKDNMPEATSEEKVTGEIDGVEYSLDLKSYTVSGQDAVNIMKPVIEQLKKDDNVLSLIDEYGATENVTRQDFIDELEDALDSLNNWTEDDLSDTVEIDIYYQDDSIAGLAFSSEYSGTYYSSTESYDMFWYSTDEEICAKLEFKEKYDDTDDPEWSYDDTMNMTFSAKLDDGATDVALRVIADDVNISYVIDDFKIVDEETGAFKGTVTFTMSADDQSLVIKGESDSTASKLDLSAEIIFNGEEYLSISVTGEETKATDVAIPSGDIYDATDDEQLEAYLATVDADKFLEDLKATLGEDLYNMLFVTYDDEYYYDYDWDYDYDYGWEYDDDYYYYDDEYYYDYDYDYNDWGTGTVVDNDYWV